MIKWRNGHAQVGDDNHYPSTPLTFHLEVKEKDEIVKKDEEKKVRTTYFGYVSTWLGGKQHWLNIPSGLSTELEAQKVCEDILYRIRESIPERPKSTSPSSLMEKQ